MPVSDARTSRPNLMFERDFSNPLSRKSATGRLIADSRGESQATSIAGNLRAPTLLCTFHDGRDKADTCRFGEPTGGNLGKMRERELAPSHNQGNAALEPVKVLNRAHPLGPTGISAGRSDCPRSGDRARWSYSGTRQGTSARTVAGWFGPGGCRVSHR